MSIVETVKVKRPGAPGGFCIINKADLTDADEIFDDSATDVKQDSDSANVDELHGVVSGTRRRPKIKK